MRPRSPDQPQSPFLRLSQCRHVTVLDTVGSSGQEPDGQRPSLASPSSPAWGAEEGRTLQQWVRAPWGGRGGLERGAAIAPRACPARGCSHLVSGCKHPKSPEKASASLRVAPPVPGQKQAEVGAGGSLGPDPPPGFASPYFPMLKVTAAPSGEAEANNVRRSPFLPVHSARPSGTSDSAVLHEARTNWSLGSLMFSSWPVLASLVPRLERLAFT